MPPELVACTGGMHNGRLVVFHRGVALEDTAVILEQDEGSACGGVWTVSDATSGNAVLFFTNASDDPEQCRSAALELSSTEEATERWTDNEATLAVGSVLEGTVIVHVGRTAMRRWRGGIAGSVDAVPFGSDSPVVYAAIADPYAVVLHEDGSIAAWTVEQKSASASPVQLADIPAAGRVSLFADSRSSLSVLAPGKAATNGDAAMEVDAPTDEVAEPDLYASRISGAKGKKAASTIGRALEGLDRIRCSHFVAVATTDGHLQVRSSWPARDCWSDASRSSRCRAATPSSPRPASRTCHRS